MPRLPTAWRRRVYPKEGCSKMERTVFRMPGFHLSCTQRQPLFTHSLTILKRSPYYAHSYS